MTEREWACLAEGTAHTEPHGCRDLSLLAEAEIWEGTSVKSKGVWLLAAAQVLDFLMSWDLV